MSDYTDTDTHHDGHGDDVQVADYSDGSHEMMVDGNHDHYAFLAGVEPVEGPDMAVAPNGSTVQLNGSGEFQAGPGLAGTVPQNQRFRLAGRALASLGGTQQHDPAHGQQEAEDEPQLAMATFEPVEAIGHLAEGIGCSAHGSPCGFGCLDKGPLGRILFHPFCSAILSGR